MEDLITQLKAMRIPFQSEQDNEGIWYSWPEEAPGLWGKGEDIETSIDDMIDNLRECVQIAAENHLHPEPAILYAKVLVSTDEELRECLAGEIYAAS